jgi:uncharacterized protein
LKIRLNDIKDKPIELVGEEPVEDYPTLTQMQAAGECEFLAPLRLQLTVTKEHDHLRVHGQVATTVRLSCSRCLTEYATAIDSPFTVFYTKASEGPQDEEIELTEEDLVAATFVGEEIDFTPVIGEQVIMSVPLKPLCKEECLGLCSNCGADLNTAPCDCDRAVVNLKFSALQNLKIDK